VVLGVVDILKIIELNFTIAVFVELLECSLDKLLSSWVHNTNNSSEELIIANCAILVNIKDTEENLSFLLSDLDSIVLDGLKEFRKLKHLVVVVVDDLEDSSETYDAAGTSLSHLVSEFLHDLLIGADIACSAAILLNIHLLS
jgi:hypothetical protein